MVYVPYMLWLWYGWYLLKVWFGQAYDEGVEDSPYVLAYCPGPGLLKERRKEPCCNMPMQGLDATFSFHIL